jgi:hypothetical protein
MKKVKTLIRTLLIFSIFVLSKEGVFAQTKFTISGYIKDASNGETMIGATIYAQEAKNGTMTNPYGFYSLSLPAGTYTLNFSYIGYVAVQKQVELKENLKLDIELGEEQTQLQEVVVTGVVEDANVTNMEMSVNKLEIKTLQRIPALLGEVDVIRSIQLLPGVSTVGEGATGFNVRGGDVGQNLVLLDEAPVYNSSHLFGFFSIFNPDAVKDVKLIKGGIPSNYGGRASSILDVRMKEGNSKEFSGNGGVGLIFSRLTLEAPIIKDKASFIVAARRSYIDILAKPFLNSDLKDSRFNFYDLTLKANYNISKKDQIFLSGYFGRDNFDASNAFRSSWGNGTTTLRWNHLFNDRLFANTTAYYSNYKYELGFGEDDDSFDWNAKIVTYSLKTDVSYFINPSNTFSFGGQSIIYKFEPGNAVGKSVGEIIDISLFNQYAMESAVYVANEQIVSNRLSLQYGLRVSHFNYLGKGTTYDYLPAEQAGERREPILESEKKYEQWESIKTYINPEPRFSLKYELNANSSIKASYNRMAQYIHLISNTTASSPLDIWSPSTKNIKPQLVDQYALGYFKNFKNNVWETSVEVFYKDMKNQVDYIDGADLLLNKFMEGDLLNGKGRAYGIEFYAKKTKGQLNGWVSYTLSKSERFVDGINSNKWFPARFDQTHNLKAVGFYDINKRLQFSATFTLLSGTPATFPTNRYEFQDYVIPHNSEGRRNNYRIPAYHRLDVALQVNGKKKEGRKWESYWVFSIYNLYGHKNPFSIYFQQDRDRQEAGQPIQTKAFRLSIVGTLIPSVSYNFSF